MDNPTASVFPGPFIEALRAAPDEPAFEYRSTTVTRAEVLRLTGRFAAALAAAGLGRGSTVALAADVSPRTFAVQIAAHTLGCRVIGLRPGLTPAHLGLVLSGGGAAADGDTGVDAVLTDGAAERPELVAAAGERPVLEFGHDLLDPHPEPAELTPAGDPESVAMIHLTSGSTGRPKGCEITYGAMSRHWSWAPSEWTPRTRALAAHYGRYLLFGTLTSAVIFEHLGLCLLGGGTAVIPDPPPSFPEVFERHRVTACLMTVPRLHQVLDTLRTRPVDTSSLRVLLVAGSPLPPHRFAEATELIGPAVHQGYGQTETGMLALLTPRELAAPEGGAAPFDSVGRVMDTVDVTVRDEQGDTLPPGTEGELWVRAPGAFRGYWGDQEETGEVLRDGWIRTRDLGSVDAGGLIRLTGRARDVIIINAIVHYAGGMERVLASHPGVDQAYVVGVPDDHTGEAAHAFVVPRAGHHPDPTELTALLVAQLGAASAPASLTFIDAPPVNAVGKPDKRALRERIPRPGERPGQ
ncbi:AMP-binding protein [Streptomyces sp. NPDC050560]|uniref:class I adenylate-forming enzyme family protein n=1 Tax=Streptomyces sp. NPDC050560 TaxID=3365630 RepID=UPI0037985A83